ncbi:MAG: ComEC/Rec2 family competence protein [Steroidobacteraceae bacterium]
MLRWPGAFLAPCSLAPPPPSSCCCWYWPWQPPAAAWLLAAGCCTELAVQRALEQRWPAADGGQRVLALVRIDSLPAPRGALRERDAQLQVEAGAAAVARCGRASPGRPPGLVLEAGERWRPVAAIASSARGAELGQHRPRAAAVRRKASQRRHGRRLATQQAACGGATRIALALRAHVAQRIREFRRGSRRRGSARGAGGRRHRRDGTRSGGACSAPPAPRTPWPSRPARDLVRLAHGRDRAARLALAAAAAAPARDWAAAAGFAAAAAYALLAGLRWTQRTLAMLGTRLLARRCARGVIRPGDVFSLALLAVLLDPFAPLTAGFWLSFGAIAGAAGRELAAGGVACGTTTRGVGRRAGSAARPSRLRTRCLLACARAAHPVPGHGFALAPATIALFASAAVAGLGGNPACDPVLLVHLVPLVLEGLRGAAVRGAAAATWQLAEFARASAWPLLESCATQPWASWQVDAAPPALLAAALALPWLPRPAPATRRVAAVLACVPLAGGRRWPPCRPVASRRRCWMPAMAWPCWSAWPARTAL